MRGQIKKCGGRDTAGKGERQKRRGGKPHLVEESERLLNEVARDLEPPGREVRAPALE